MNIKYFGGFESRYELGKEIIFEDKDIKFFSFQYFSDAKFNERMKLNSINNFINDVNTLFNSKSFEEVKFKADISRFPILYKDIERDRSFKMPFIFSPIGNPRVSDPLSKFKLRQSTGNGRALIACQYFPDIKFDYIVNNTSISGLDVSEKLVSNIKDSKYWKNKDLSGMHSMLQIEQLGEINFVANIEFDYKWKHDPNVYYTDAPYAIEIEENIELCKMVYKKAKETKFEETKDYLNFLDKIILYDC